ncbi:MAG TPA: EamA family transporter [Bacteroidota bacterium]|nr:EamA family transporter [Bacteroidota bacterium]
MNWLILATSSALCSAAAAIAEKKALFRISALEFSLSVSLLVLLLSLFVPLTVDVATIPGNQILLIVGKSILGGGAFLLVMLSLRHNEISEALPLLGLTPAVAALLSMASLGDGLSWREWLGIVLMIAGIYVLEKKPGGGILVPLKSLFTAKGHRYVFSALALFAISSVLDKLLISGYRVDPLVVLFYQHCTYAGIFAVAVFSRRSVTRSFSLHAREQLPLIALVAILTLGYRITQLEATKEAPVALVLAVKRTSILFASLLGGKLFSDERLNWKLAGGALIVAAGFFILRNVG